jgi:NitT/TauT family transport system substrate-binding protein
LALAGVALVGSVSLVVAGLAAAGSSERQATKVTVQLKWVTQAQFAGYYAAKAKGFYDKLGLDVNIKVGGPDIIPEQVVLGKQAEFGVDWLPSLLATRDKGGKIVNIAQVFTRSGVTEVVFRDSGITNFCQLKGKKVGVWLGGNEFEQYAALQKCGINPSSRSDVTIVKQNFDMVAFLQRQIDAASAMTYNELAQVLETKNPKTGKLYTLKDLRVFKMQNLGTGMLEDGLFVREDWIKDKANQATAVKFIQGTLQGWTYCRTHFRECVNIVLKNGPTLGRGHQTWQMNEINALIWPAPKGIGIMDAKSYAQTARISLRYKVINKPAGKAYIDTYAKRAVAALKKQGLDVNGRSWKPANVKVTPGGK